MRLKIFGMPIGPEGQPLYPGAEELADFLTDFLTELEALGGEVLVIQTLLGCSGPRVFRCAGSLDRDCVTPMAVEPGMSSANI